MSDERVDVRLRFYDPDFAALRETQEIEVHMRHHDNAQIGFSAVGDAYAHAASIARGKEN